MNAIFQNVTRYYLINRVHLLYLLKWKYIALCAIINVQIKKFAVVRYQSPLDLVAESSKQ